MSLIFRKAEEIGSAIFRNCIFPFKKICIEITTKSILKQKCYVKNSNLDGKNYVGKNSVVMGSTMGFGSYVGDDCIVKNISIGKYTSIGPQFLSAFGSHPTKDYMAMHPAFLSANPHQGFTYVKKDYYKEQKYVEGKYQVKVGNDVWIGARVTVLDGVSIGDGAVVAAGALVNKDIEPYAIYGGVPAKKIGSRFDADMVEKLSMEKWWDFDEDQLKNIAKDMTCAKEYFAKK